MVNALKMGLFYNICVFMFMYYTVCYFSVIFYSVVIKISMLFIDNKDSIFCILYSVLCIQLHREKRLSPKIVGFVVILRSKLDPYTDELLHARVINSSRSGFSSWVTAKCETFVV